MPPPPPSGDVDAADDDAWNGTYVIKRAKNFDEYDTIRDVILTCAQKPTRVSLIYRTERSTKKWKT